MSLGTLVISFLGARSATAFPISVTEEIGREAFW